MQNRESILVYGSNTAFNIRAAEILKRKFELIEIEHDIQYDNSGIPTLVIPQPDIFIAQIVLHRIQRLFFSSETLLFFKNDQDFQAFFALIELISKYISGEKIIFISIENPNALNDMFRRSFNEFNTKILFKTNDLFNKFNCRVHFYKSYFTYTESIFQINPLNFGNCRILSGTSADLIIDQVVNSINGELDPLFVNGSDDFNTEIYRNHRRLMGADHLMKAADLIGVSEEVIAHQNECSIRLLYRHLPSEMINDNSVASIRLQMGISLFDQIPKEVVKLIDYVVPVPETGKYYAQGFAKAAKVPYVEAIFKQSNSGRSFDILNPENRNMFIHKKLGVLIDVLSNKTIGLIDEAIFTGATLKIAVFLLKTVKVKEIFIFIPSPVCRSQCKYNMQPARVMLSNYIRDDDLKNYFGVGGIYFQSLDNYTKLMFNHGYKCINCFN